MSKSKKPKSKNMKAVAAADQENARARDERAKSSDGMTASERAMAQSAKSKPAKKAKAPKAAKPPKEKRPSGLDLAAKAVASAKEPLNAKTIAERAIAAGWKTSGKTPHATLYAAIVREIAEKGKDSRFKKTDRGLFTAMAVGK